MADFPEIVELEDVISTYDDFIEVMTRQAPPLLPARDGRSPRDEHWVGPRPLADEHAILLHEVRSRGRLVRAAISAGRWPGRQVAGLVDYLRSRSSTKRSPRNACSSPSSGRVWQTGGSRHSWAITSVCGT